MKIPFIDLKARHDQIRPEIDAAIARVLDHGQFIMGPEVAQLEEELCKFVGSKHCISMSNGTDALVAALMALGVGVGDAVITTPFTFFATVEAIMILGATPVFADIDPATFNICPNEVEKAIKRVRQENDLNLKGIIPVDLYGLCADYQSLNKLAQENGLFVLQDSAQAFGATTPDGKRAPTHGDIGTASFFPAKPLGCYGDGGACFTDNDKLASLLRSIRVHGKGTDKYDNVRVGQNCRLDTLQAAILLEKLKVYSEDFGLRQKVAGKYDQLFSAFPDLQVSAPVIPSGFHSAWAQYTIRHPDRDSLAVDLKTQGIPTAVYYRTPVNLSGAVSEISEEPFACPVSEQYSKQVLSLPFSPSLVGSSFQIVAEAIKRLAKF